MSYVFFGCKEGIFCGSGIMSANYGSGIQKNRPEYKKTESSPEHFYGKGYKLSLHISTQLNRD